MDISRWNAEYRPFKRDGLTIIVRPGPNPIKPDVYVYCGGRVIFGVRKITLHADVKELFPIVGVEAPGLQFGEFVGDGYEQLGKFLNQGDLILSVRNFFHAASSNIPSIANVLLQHLDTDNDCEFGGSIGILQAMDFEAHTDGAKLVLTYLDISNPDATGDFGIASSEVVHERIKRFREMAFVEIKFRESGADVTPRAR